MIDYSKFVKNSREWLSQYIKNNRLQSLCIGISGGIDSTVSACIASPVCKELGIPLIGRSLPTGTNKQSECDVADLVGNAFCTDYKVIALDRTYGSVMGQFESNEKTMSTLQAGNVKARLRMIYLYSLASIHKGVVLDNDNFTEWNLGFWTLKGDEGDINLGLHYLWKTEIYELAKYLLEQCNIEWEAFDDFENSEMSHKADIACAQYEALKASINLTPTDGNGVSNSDCEQFGLDNYEQVDAVLKTMYYPRLDENGMANSNEYIRLIDSYNEQGVDKVMLLHQNTTYKRKELPIKPTKEELGL